MQNTVEIASPALVPDQPVDRAHLFRMTLGDHGLEGEVLRLFDRQVNMLMTRMASAEPNCIKALAHTLDGSARGVGAFRVSQAAQEVERAVAESGDVGAAVEALKAATDEALVVIAELLRVH
jgi:hypothetical protein